MVVQYDTVDISDHFERIRKRYKVRGKESDYIKSEVGAFTREGLGELRFTLTGRVQGTANLNDLRELFLPDETVHYFYYPESNRYYRNVHSLGLQEEETGGIPNLYPISVDLITKDPFKYSTTEGTTIATVSPSYLEFEGISSSYGRITRSSTLEPSSVAVECYVRTTTSQLQYLVDKYSTSGGTYYGYALYLNSSAYPCFFIGSGGTTSKTANSGTAIDDGKWHHILGSYDGSNVRIYVDGNLGTLESFTDGIGYDTNKDIYFGAVGTGESSLLTGDLKGIRISSFREASDFEEYPYTVDSYTKGLWRMNEGSGNVLDDAKETQDGTAYNCTWGGTPKVVSILLSNSGNVKSSPTIEIVGIGSVVLPSIEDINSRVLTYDGTVDVGGTLTITSDYTALMGGANKDKYVLGQFPVIEAIDGSSETWTYYGLSGTAEVRLKLRSRWY